MSRVGSRAAVLGLALVLVAGSLLGCASDEDEPASTAPAPSTVDEGSTGDAGSARDDGSGGAPTGGPEGSGEPEGSSQAQAYPDVLSAEVVIDGDRASVRATISSPYDSEARYADAFRVLGPDGTVLGIRELTHPHADEQPFTRSLGGVEIPEGVATVTVEARDSANGWGGGTASAPVPGR